MKLASVLAGATAVALTLTATAASAGPDIDRGAATGTVNIRPIPILFPGLRFSGTTQDTGLVNLADAAQTFGLLPGNVALFTMDMNGFTGNTANTTSSNGATFSLSGQVSKDCAYYTGGTDTTVNFGEIGIDTSDNNPSAAFEMVDTQRTLDISSNLAGCNTKNTVKFTKTDLTNAAQDGFDGEQFTNVIPVELTADFRAGVPGATGNAGPNSVKLLQAGAQASESTYGAWRSPLNMQVKMKNPGLALLAGSYTGTVSVTIAVAQ